MYIQDLLITDKEQVAFDDIFLSEGNKASIQQFIKEHTYIDTLAEYGLPVNNKLLLQGASGCGKTMTAKAIALQLNKPIYILNLSNVICARIGETSQNIKNIFDKAGRERAVLFLDEFDQIAKARDNDDRDVGEMRRLVNTIIQLIDYYPEKAVLIAATNHEYIIDSAILRRFQLRLAYEMPSKEILDKYYDSLLLKFPIAWQSIPRKYDISFAETKDYIFTSMKAILIAELESKAQ